MKFLLDHCVPGKLKSLLKQSGYPSVALKELGKADAENSEVINIAKSQESILVTCDIDFSDIREYPPGSHTGIIVLKIDTETKEQVYSVFLKAIQEINPSILTRALVIIDKNRYRVREKGL